LGFLPIPPIVSVIYVACGHGVLRAAHSAHYVAVPLISSVRAAAAGGAILSLPLAVLLYLLLFPTKPPDPEDFFEDEEDTRELWWMYSTYAVRPSSLSHTAVILTPRRYAPRLFCALELFRPLWGLSVCPRETCSVLQKLRRRGL
jgi:hypothetical protein